MNIRHIILTAAMIIAGCSKVEVPETFDGAMHFNVLHPATKATETSFEAGDKMGVYVTAYENGKPLALQLGGNYKNNNLVTFDGKKWRSDPVIYWNNDIPKYDVYAYYPFAIPSSVDEMPFSVALDQRTMETTNALSAYEASDFLFATAKGVTSDGGPVNLTFRHKMSKLTVNIKKGADYEGDLPATATLLIHNTVPECLIDLATGDVIKDPYESAKTITARQIDAGKYTAIIVPQMITNKKPLIEIVFKDVSYLVESKFQFKGGTHHILNITVNNNPDKVKIEIGGEIQNDWTI